MQVSAEECQYFPQIPDLSLGWLVGRSGHCTVSGPSGDGVSGAPSGRGDSASCCSSVRGCSSIQLANTSMVWESRSPATSRKDHREVKPSELKKKPKKQEVDHGALDGVWQELMCEIFQIISEGGLKDPVMWDWIKRFSEKIKRPIKCSVYPHTFSCLLVNDKKKCHAWAKKKTQS